jgi:SAM-dependent methyltransferase
VTLGTTPSSPVAGDPGALASGAVSTGPGRSLLAKVLYRVRNYRSRVLFDMLRRHSRGTVLDVGGGDFVETLDGRGIAFDHWIVVEPDSAPPITAGARASFVQGDGCVLGVASNSVDTVVSLQVLEHVFDPALMVGELSRVLKPGGHGIILVPTTSTMHLAPHFFYNFSRFWIFEAMKRANLEIVEFKALGGIWSSMASHLVYLGMQATRQPGMSDPAIKRNLAFWVLLPVQFLFAAVALPICMLLSLGDLQEEPNNHALVVRKPGGPATSG